MKVSRNLSGHLNWVVAIFVMGGAAIAVGANAVEIARVNGQSLSEKDLSMALSSLNEGQKQEFLKNINNRREILFNILDREVLAQEAERLKLDESQAFKESMNLYRKQLLMKMVLEKKVLTQLTHKAVKEYYKTHRDWFSTDQVRVQHVLLHDENEAHRVLELAQDPKSNFQDLAIRYSKDPGVKTNRGELGFLTHDRMVPDFMEAAFSAPVGKAVGPIPTLYGYHLIKVIQKKNGKPFEFEDVELQVRAALQKQLVRNYTNELKEKTPIQVDNAILENL